MCLSYRFLIIVQALLNKNIRNVLIDNQIYLLYIFLPDTNKKK